ncbi:hypothetical protein PR003_g8302 [Phytophthora rubi]|uniref:Uncharacterized protein n=1 Tax=Phytophthora rubi TaxID=129364 RepID=A0A6A4FJG8_9STRA|nr:hypothetical protein PR002_g7830 [Phytophthora rubi]KAE9050300.1 hypothetical protein PR001_g2512 [Phytophthora rubi]KAE9344738.1 hypothetical protein PR003_g8302 [Phytophthora rubi]
MDEKWFYVKKVGQKVYVSTGKDGTPLEAVARPRGGWDGKIGLWPVV